MFTRFDKAGVAAISAAVTGLLAAFTTLDPEAVAAVGTLVTTLLVFFVPNKEAVT